MKVLFVCLGNICRSPMAHALMRHMQSDHIVDSCGTSSWHQGERPHRGTLMVLQENGISSQNLHSRPLTPQDFEDFDLIIGMDNKNVRDLRAKCPPNHRDKIHLFLSKVPGKKNQDVPDPWYTDNFEETFRLTKLGVQAWIDALEKNRV